MIQNEVLDLAIGLVFVWFILSLIISVVNEGLALVFRIRAKQLWLGIDRLLDPKNGQYSRRFWDTVLWLPSSRKNLDLRPIANTESADTAGMPKFNTEVAGDDRHATLQKIYDGLAPMVTDVALAGRKSKLTKISGEVFADAMAALAGQVHPADLVTAANALGWNEALINALTAATANLPPDMAIDRATIDTLDMGAGIGSAQQSALFDRASSELTARDIAGLFSGNPSLKAAIENAAAATGIDDRLVAVKTTVQTWFDREMEQATALYRRQNRKVLALLALPVVLIFQANTLGIIADLRSDAALREAISNEAVSVAGTSTLDEVINQHCAPAASSDGTATSGTGGGTTGGTTGGTGDSGGGTRSPNGTANSPDAFDGAVDRFACVAKIVRAAGVFAIVPDIDKRAALDPSQGPFFGMSVADIWDYEIHEYGWLGRGITLVALLFGAQFWFDILRRLVGFRKSAAGVGVSAAG